MPCNSPCSANWTPRSARCGCATSRTTRSIWCRWRRSPPAIGCRYGRSPCHFTRGRTSTSTASSASPTRSSGGCMAPASARPCHRGNSIFASTACTSRRPGCRIRCSTRSSPTVSATVTRRWASSITSTNIVARRSSARPGASRSAATKRGTAPANSMVAIWRASMPSCTTCSPSGWRRSTSTPSSIHRATTSTTPRTISRSTRI